MAHFSYEHSDENIMVVDMQGSDYVLFDPEIASRELLDGEEVLFSAGNLSITAITTFIDRPSDRVRGCGTAQSDQSRTIPHNF